MTSGYLLVGFGLGVATPFAIEAASKLLQKYKAYKAKELRKAREKVVKKQREAYNKAFTDGALSTVLKLAEQMAKAEQAQKTKRVHEVYVLGEDMTVKGCKSTEFCS